MVQVQPISLKSGSNLRSSEYGDGDGRGMDPAAPLSRRHTLDTMASRLVIEVGSAFSFNFESNAIPPVLSTDTVAQPRVGAQQVATEQPGVLAALGWPNFYCAFHSVLLDIYRNRAIYRI